MVWEVEVGAGFLARYGGDIDAGVLFVHIALHGLGRPHADCHVSVAFTMAVKDA